MIDELHFWATLLLPTLATVLVGWWLRRENVATRDKVAEVHILINSRMTEMLATKDQVVTGAIQAAVAAKSVGFAEGVTTALTGIAPIPTKT